ncbi:hypothetical protein HYV43_03160 [Candidatus Micrarchaeota archaeon]|nr:hypothetical protein [Candidatus Micrarchaeota archaeon]
MKKRWWFWFLAWTIPFLAIMFYATPGLAFAIVGFFALYGLLAWRRTAYTRDFKTYKTALKDPQPLAELGLAGLLVLLFLMVAYDTPNEAFLVLAALIPLLLSMAFPPASAPKAAAKR